MDGTLRASVSWVSFSHSRRQLNIRTVDYNSWQESETGRKLADSLDKDVVLAEGALSARICLKYPSLTYVLYRL